MKASSHKQRGIDVASWLTLALTVVLFSLSLIEKGFTHEILLEAGVFLVSLKLVLASHREQLDIRAVDEKLEQLLARQSFLAKRRRHSPGGSVGRRRAG